MSQCVFICVQIIVLLCNFLTVITVTEGALIGKINFSRNNTSC